MHGVSSSTPQVAVRLYEKDKTVELLYDPDVTLAATEVILNFHADTNSEIRVAGILLENFQSASYSLTLAPGASEKVEKSDWLSITQNNQETMYNLREIPGTPSLPYSSVEVLQPSGITASINERTVKLECDF